MLHFYVHLHMFACMAQVFKFHIHACVVYASGDLNDEMKTSMHRKSNQTCAYHVKTRPFAYIVDLTGYSSFCECLATIGAKDDVYWQLRLVSRFKGPFFTPQHHLVVITLPQFLIHAYVQAFKSKLLAHMQGELMLPIRVYATCPFPLHMVKCLGKQHESKRFH